MDRTCVAGKSMQFEGLESRTMLTGDLQFAASVGAIQTGMATDSEGSVYVVGMFTGTVDFNPSQHRTYSLTAVNAGGDAFLARYSLYGGLYWVVQLGDATNAPVPTGVLAAYGRIWVTGQFQGAVDFDPTSGTTNLTSSGGKDAFVWAMAEDGSFFRANQYGGATTDEVPVGLGIDSTNADVYIAGNISGGANIRTFNVMYNPKIRFVRANSWGSGGVDVVATAFTSDGQGDSFIAGTVSGNFDFNGGAAGGAVTGPTAFLLKVSSGGSYRWVGQLDNATITSLASFQSPVTGPFPIVATGLFSGTVDVNFSASQANLLGSVGGTDAFVVKYDANGAYLWAKSMGGPQDDISYSVDMDAGGSVYIGGLFRDTATFPRGQTLISRGGTDAFAAKYDIYGKQRYLVQMGGAGNDQVDTLAVGQGADIYLCGPLFASGDYGGVTLAPLPGHAEDLYLLRLD